MHAARRLWHILEPLHAVVYFAPEVRESGRAIGLRGFWDTYFAYRAAPLGPVGADVVVAAFAGFEPGMVGRALPSAWSRASAPACLAARSAVCAEVLRSVGVSREACAAAVPALAPVVSALEPTGRPLGAANAALPLPADPVAALWQLATTVREHRGDGHVAALVHAGLSGLDALLLQAALGRVPSPAMRQARGWSEEAWARGRASLTTRGLLADDGPTARGRALLASVEEWTDASAWDSGLAVLGETGVNQVAATLTPAVDAVWRSGMLPEANPIGLPRA